MQHTMRSAGTSADFGRIALAWASRYAVACSSALRRCGSAISSLCATALQPLDLNIDLPDR
jgi:hypothetical protein